MANTVIEDGAQTVFGCKVSRLYEAHPCLPPLHGIFSLEDGRFCQQPDEHDKPRLHVDIVLQSEQLRKQEAAQQSARHGKYDRERDEKLSYSAHNIVNQY